MRAGTQLQTFAVTWVSTVTQLLIVVGFAISMLLLLMLLLLMLLLLCEAASAVTCEYPLGTAVAVDDAPDTKLTIGAVSWSTNNSSISNSLSSLVGWLRLRRRACATRLLVLLALLVLVLVWLCKCVPLLRAVLAGHGGAQGLRRACSEGQLSEVQPMPNQLGWLQR